MAVAVAGPAAPLLAGGPPGWLAYGVIVGGAGILSYLAYDALTEEATQTGTATGTQTDTQTRRCDRPYTVVVHAQGSDITSGDNGGTSGATIGAAPIVNPTTPITTGQAIGLSVATHAMLNRTQLRMRSQTQSRLESWIRGLPPTGYLGKRSFNARGDTRSFRGVRSDLDSYGCTPNMIA
jgi:hypothetical protein